MRKAAAAAVGIAIVLTVGLAGAANAAPLGNPCFSDLIPFTDWLGLDCASGSGPVNTGGSDKPNDRPNDKPKKGQSDKASDKPMQEPNRETRLSASAPPRG